MKIKVQMNRKKMSMRVYKIMKMRFQRMILVTKSGNNGL